MTDFLDQISALSPKRLALLALELHEQLEAETRRASEPIAVVGMSCRFPGGANNLEQFWSLLHEGRDGIVDIPGNRWNVDDFFDANPDAAGKMSVRNGGFLDRVDGFDAAFFGVSPREALTMDPQQRLLLEVAWEALENAGIAPSDIAGTETGVFMGVCNSDHFQRVLTRGSDSIDAYMASGNAHSVASGRIAYFLGAQGPALSIDTACSSSLVALHVACRSLRGRESRIALAGGVNIMCSPETTIALSKAHMLAPDGRCKTFDASADGFSRGEGCGVLVLKRLTDATTDGDRILAIIRGSASNQDGRSSGLTVPNGPAQEAVIRAALKDAGVNAGDVDYVEAHGTGTSLGDPIEVRALANAYGGGRRDTANALLIGSVKTNIGHLESAAGIAGVIKVILSLQHELIPKQLHFSTPSPHIAWSDFPVSVVSKHAPWGRSTKPRVAGVSSFGFSGTNAHVIIEEAPIEQSASPHNALPAYCFPMSAHSDDVVREIASSVVDVMDRRLDISVADVAQTLSVGRSHFNERRAIVADTREAVRVALSNVANNTPAENVFRGSLMPGAVPEVVFMFTGQGAQYPGMSAQLYALSPVFREVIDRCDAIIGTDVNGRTLRSVLHDQRDDATEVHQTSWTQPALFAVEYGLAALWQSWGVIPAAVIGHSVGEYVAACVAGVFSLEDGLRLIAERGRLMQSLPSGGAMAAFFAPADEVAKMVEDRANDLSIAAINADDSIVVSGNGIAIDSLLTELAARNIKGHRLRVSLAGHSPQVEPILDQLRAFASRIAMHAPQIPVAWNLTGTLASNSATPDADYWCDHLRKPVKYGDGIKALYRDGYRTFLEVGPHPTLGALAQRSLPEASTQILASLRRGKSDWHEMMTSLARLYTLGAPIKWREFASQNPAARVTLPTYPFNRTSYWIESVSSAARSVVPSHVVPIASSENVLVGQRLSTALPAFETTLSADLLPYLSEHRVAGAVLAPAPLFIEMTQAAAQSAWGKRNRCVDEFTILHPLVLPAEGRVLQVQFSNVLEDSASFTVHSRSLDQTEWQLHVQGVLRTSDALKDHQAPHATRFSSDLAHNSGPLTPGKAYYEQLAEMGVQLGASFRAIRDVRTFSAEAIATVQLPELRRNDNVVWAHPALMDGVLQTVGVALLTNIGKSDQIYLISAIEHVELYEPLPVELTCHARLREDNAHNAAERFADISLSNMEGKAIGEIRGICVRPVAKETIARLTATSKSSEWFYDVFWERLPLGAVAAEHLANPQHIQDSTNRTFEELASTSGLSTYDSLLPELDILSLLHIGDALRALNFDTTPQRSFTANAEANKLGVASARHRLFERLLNILAEAHILRLDGAQFSVQQALPGGDVSSTYESLISRFSPVTGELQMLRRTGPSLGKVLTGEVEPVQLLFPNGSFAEAKQLYIESPYAQTYNGALADALKRAIANLPSNARIRVLEIGGGTGGTTNSVLPLLPSGRTEYTFTDISPLFLERAAETFGRFQSVKYALFDVERDPQSQGFAPESFDIVIAANVLHATSDLRRSVNHARQLLAPGGELFALEGVTPQRWVDLTFGLTDGWWKFNDPDLRPNYPLIDRTKWIALLTECGFESAVAIPSTASNSGATTQTLLIAKAVRKAKHWLIVGHGNGIADSLTEAVRKRGDVVTQMSASAREMQPTTYDVALYLGAIDNGANSDLNAHRWLATFGKVASRVWIATTEAQVVDASAASNTISQASTWGWARGFGLEYPVQWGGIVDLPVGSLTGSDTHVTQLLASIDGDDDNDQSAWRNGTRYVARLNRIPAPTAKFSFKRDACYLVTGGFGGLGLLVAKWMAENGAGHIALMGRHVDTQSEGYRAIESAGARVYPVLGDIGNELDVARVLAELKPSAPALRGVLHAASAFSTAKFAELSNAQIAEMLTTKKNGAQILERLSRDLELDFLVLFSSTTALLGASGFAHYAAANAFLDALAESASARNDGHTHVLSINWGTWASMRLASAESQRSYVEVGLEPMETSNALDALGSLLGSKRSRATVASINWSALKPLHEARRQRPLLSRVGNVSDKAVAAEKPIDTGPSLVTRLAAAPAAMRYDFLVEFVQSQVAHVLGLPVPSRTPVHTGLFDMGMDSLMAVELKRRLEAGAGRSLPSTLTFNYPNVAALATFLQSQLSMNSSSGATTVSSTPAQTKIIVPNSDASLAELSDDELEARLLARLEQSK